LRAEPASERKLNATAADLETLRESDFVSLHTLLSPGTRHSSQRAHAPADEEDRHPDQRRPRSGRGRGGAGESALGHWIRGAGLDVFEDEPKIDPRLLPLSDVTLAPHIASAAHETRVGMAMLAVRNCLAVLEGKPALTPVS
jgi:glyoxylate reductase